MNARWPILAGLIGAALVVAARRTRAVRVPAPEPPAGHGGGLGAGPESLPRDRPAAAVRFPALSQTAERLFGARTDPAGHAPGDVTPGVPDVSRGA